MITGTLVVDRNNYFLFAPNGHMIDPKLSHLTLMVELARGGVLLYSSYAYSFLQNLKDRYPEMLGQFSTKIYIDTLLETVIKENEHSDIMMVGNRLVFDNMSSLDQLIVIKYHSDGYEPQPLKLELPMDPILKSSLLRFDVLTYRLKNV